MKNRSLALALRYPVRGQEFLLSAGKGIRNGNGNEICCQLACYMYMLYRYDQQYSIIVTGNDCTVISCVIVAALEI